MHSQLAVNQSQPGVVYNVLKGHSDSTGSSLVSCLVNRVHETYAVLYTITCMSPSLSGLNIVLFH